jgi:hypothetical protein
LALWEIASHSPDTKIDPHRARPFPLGLCTLGRSDHIVHRGNSVSRFTRSRKLSSRTSPSSRRSIRGIRLHMLWRKSRAADNFNWQNGVRREHRFKTQSLGTCRLSEADLNAESSAGSSPITSELSVNPRSRRQGRIELPLRGSDACVSATNEIKGRCESSLLHHRNEPRIVCGHIPVFVRLAPIMPSPFISGIITRISGVGYGCHQRWTFTDRVRQSSNP